MQFNREITQFALDAEVDAFGTKRIVDAFNNLFRENKVLKEKMSWVDDGLVVEQLQKELEQVRIHCEIRERALYKIRSLVKPGTEISKTAGEALCYGNYTRSP